MAPRTSSSHMKKKRSCPGVPNRERTRSRAKVMRPKSSATVVVVLRRPPTSSTPVEWVVIAASVDSGGISEIEPTNVVLPAPKPPATTIFTGIGVPGVWGSDVAEAMQHPFEERDVVGGRLDRDGAVRFDGTGLGLFNSEPRGADGMAAADDQHPVAGEVAHQHTSDTERHSRERGDLDDRQWGAAQLEDRPPLSRPTR